MAREYTFSSNVFERLGILEPLDSPEALEALGILKCSDSPVNRAPSTEAPRSARVRKAPCFSMLPDKESKSECSLKRQEPTFVINIQEDPFWKSDTCLQQDIILETPTTESLADSNLPYDAPCVPIDEIITSDYPRLTSEDLADLSVLEPEEIPSLFVCPTELNIPFLVEDLEIIAPESNLNEPPDATYQYCTDLLSVAENVEIYTGPLETEPLQVEPELKNTQIFNTEEICTPTLLAVKKTAVVKVYTNKKVVSREKICPKKKAPKTYSKKIIREEESLFRSGPLLEIEPMTQDFQIDIEEKIPLLKKKTKVGRKEKNPKKKTIKVGRKEIIPKNKTSKIKSSTRKFVKNKGESDSLEIEPTHQSSENGNTDKNSELTSPKKKMRRAQRGAHNRKIAAYFDTTLHGKPQPNTNQINLPDDLVEAVPQSNEPECLLFSDVPDPAPKSTKNTTSSKKSGVDFQKSRKRKQPWEERKDIFEKWSEALSFSPIPCIPIASSQNPTDLNIEPQSPDPLSDEEEEESKQIKTKHKRQYQTTEFKLKILEEIDKGLRKREIAKKHNINVATVYNYERNREKIKISAQFVAPGTKKLNRSRYVDIEYHLLSYLTKCKVTGVPLTVEELSEEAQKIAKHLGYKKINCKANSTWILRFVQRFQLQDSYTDPSVTVAKWHLINDPMRNCNRKFLCDACRAHCVGVDKMMRHLHRKHKIEVGGVDIKALPVTEQFNHKAYHPETVEYIM